VELNCFGDILYSDFLSGLKTGVCALLFPIKESFLWALRCLVWVDDFTTEAQRNLHDLMVTHEDENGIEL
jgi:hypothetical protein